MRGLGGVLGLCAVAAAAPGGPHPDINGCSITVTAPTGILTVTAWTTPLRRPPYTLRWETAPARPGAHLEIVPWDIGTVAPPPNRTLVMIDMPNRGGDGLRRRLELHGPSDGIREPVLARGPWMRGPYTLLLDLPLGRLRERARGRPVAAVIADRAGRVWAHETIEPALLDAPAAAIEAGRAQWGVLAQASPGVCPAGTEPVVRIFVTG